MAPLAGPGKETVSTKRGSEEEVLGGLLFLFYNLKFLISDAWLNLDLAIQGTIDAAGNSFSLRCALLHETSLRVSCSSLSP